jgi:uncharacterized protein YdhG (YjbR/CyaY superfamily)
VQSRAASVADYLESLPPDRRKELATLRAAIKKHLPRGYAEVMQSGMISYVVPLKLYPEGYLGNKDVPLPFASLAAQKNYFAVYLMNVYGDADLERWFRDAFAKSGKKLDMGKSCVRFKKAADLPLDVITEAVARTPVEAYVARYEAARGVTSVKAKR